MEKTKKRSPDIKRSWKTKATILLCIAALGLVSCAPVMADPSNSTTSTSTVQSIDKTTYVTYPLQIDYQTTPLNVTIDQFGVVLSIDSPPDPCGNTINGSATPANTDPTITYERAKLCSNISDASRLLGAEQDQSEIESIAGKIIILNSQETNKLCDSIAGACYLSVADKTIIDHFYNKVTTLIHEETHSLRLSDGKFFDETSNACFLYNSSPAGGFIMTYQDESSTTGWSTIIMSRELIPSIAEMDVIKKLNADGNYMTNYPAYFLVAKPDQNGKEELRKMLENLNFSESDSAFLIKDSPITMETLYKYVEGATGSPSDLALLADFFNKVLVGDETDKYTPIQTSQISPTDACR